MTPTIAVFGSSATAPGSTDWTAAHDLGRGLGERGWRVVTGGYDGTMRAVSEGAASAGGHVMGITAPSVFPDRSGANGSVAEEIVAGSMSERIHLINHVADASISLPGSIGTLTELMVAWNSAFVAPFSRSQAKPVIVVGSTWADLTRHIAETIATDLDLLTVVADATAALEHLETVFGFEVRGE